MEPMTIHFISAVTAEDGSVRARVRVESKAHHQGRPTMTMSLLLWLPPTSNAALGHSLPQRVYDEALRYLDVG